MEFSEIADELYAGPPEQFVARRKELADQAKKAGDKELAKQVGALRKPTKAAWVVNLLAHREPDRIESWLELGTALTEAQQTLARDQLRELNNQRTSAARQLSRRAIELAAEAGQPINDATAQEVAATLQAAWTDPEVAELVRHGRVHQVVSYGGFGPLNPDAVPPPAREPEQEPEPAEKSPRPDRKTRAAEERKAKEQREREERERAEREAMQSEIDAADRELESATATLTDLRKRQAELTEKLKQITAEERNQAKIVAELRAHATALRRR